MGVVAPVSGVGAVLVPVVVGVAHRRAPRRRWSGSASLLALPGDLAGLAASRSTGPPGGPGSGSCDGVLAGLGFGTLFAALAQIPAEAGFLPLALNQLVAGGAIIVVATGAAPGLGAAQPVRPRRR